MTLLAPGHNLLKSPFRGHQGAPAWPCFGNNANLPSLHRVHPPLPGREWGECVSGSGQGSLGC